MAEVLIGTVTHYYSKLGVATIILTGSLRLGDAVHFLGKNTDFQQAVESLQIEHQDVQEAKAGDHIGMMVKEKVREKDQVYKVE